MCLEKSSPPLRAQLFRAKRGNNAAQDLPSTPAGPPSCLPLWAGGPASVSEDSPGFRASASADGSPDALQNPCYIGTHGCDTNAACQPGRGTQFTCECSVGFRGDGRTCYGTALGSALGRWGRQVGRGSDPGRQVLGEGRKRAVMGADRVLGPHSVCPPPPAPVRGTAIKCSDSEEQCRVCKATLRCVNAPVKGSRSQRCLSRSQYSCDVTRHVCVSCFPNTMSFNPTTLTR